MSPTGRYGWGAAIVLLLALNALPAWGGPPALATDPAAAASTAAVSVSAPTATRRRAELPSVSARRRLDPDHVVAMAAGVHDLITGPKTAVLGMEYRVAPRWYGVRPTLGLMTTLQGAMYGYGGIRYEIESKRRPFVFAVGTAIGAYRRGGDVRLGHVLEFRSGFEFGWVVAGGDSVSVGFHHLSNASIARSNPGTEVLSWIYAFRLHH